MAAKSLTGLNAALGPGWDPANQGLDENDQSLHQRALGAETDAYAGLDPMGDPLGIQRSQMAQNLIGATPAGGMSDWLQALNEKAPGGVKGPKGIDPLAGIQAPGQTYDPLFQTSAVNPSLAALQTLTHRAKMQNDANDAATVAAPVKKPLTFLPKGTQF
jgi:hypothetical protein